MGEKRIKTAYLWLLQGRFSVQQEIYSTGIQFSKLNQKLLYMKILLAKQNSIWTENNIERESSIYHPWSWSI